MTLIIKESTKEKHNNIEYSQDCNNTSGANVYIPKADFRLIGWPKVTRGANSEKVAPRTYSLSSEAHAFRDKHLRPSLFAHINCLLLLSAIRLFGGTFIV